MLHVGRRAAALGQQPACIHRKINKDLSVAQAIRREQRHDLRGILALQPFTAVKAKQEGGAEELTERLLIALLQRRLELLQRGIQPGTGQLHRHRVEMLESAVAWAGLEDLDPSWLRVGRHGKGDDAGVWSALAQLTGNHGRAAADLEAAGVQNAHAQVLLKAATDAAHRHRAGDGHSHGRLDDRDLFHRLCGHGRRGGGGCGQRPGRWNPQALADVNAIGIDDAVEAHDGRGRDIEAPCNGIERIAAPNDINDGAALGSTGYRGRQRRLPRRRGQRRALPYARQQQRPQQDTAHDRRQPQPAH